MVYNRGNTSEPESLDPHKTSTVSEAHILRDLFEGLVMPDARGDLIPGAAESWTISDDGTVYTFKLRDDAVWSNGDPVTAEDFVYSFGRLRESRDRRRNMPRCSMSSRMPRRSMRARRSRRRSAPAPSIRRRSKSR